ncbi:MULTISPECIES: hypothetical protein [Haloprofundus]|uniref:hypothetical protein n=1 Tax=Haloprofundus TaxID=1911573 RepID=UPI000E44F8FD|nr:MULTISPECIES: hypothetical protein [Haloprofundus]QCJ48422.1 hypothetical protein FCF25_15360 [Haloprofundus sp. MHR1]
MNEGNNTKRCVVDITAKLEAGVDLDSGDVKFVLGYIPSLMEYGELEAYRDNIDEAVTSEVGHAVYASILRDFETMGVINELRRDLIDPSLDPDGFERVETSDRTRYRGIRIGEDATEGVGWLDPPEKEPTSLSQIRSSLFDYLFCTGRGFYLDAEMIYDIETDYREFLRAVIDCTDGLGRYELTVDCDDNGKQSIVRISLDLEDRSYQQEFEQVSDWLRFDALDPVQAALDRETSQTVHYSGGNDGWILVLENVHEDLVRKYI